MKESIRRTWLSCEVTILLFSLSFFASVREVHSYDSISTATAWKKSSAGRINRYTDQVVVGRVHLTWFPEAIIHVTRATIGAHRASEGRHPRQALTLLEEARFIGWYLRPTFLREMLTRPEAFWGMQETSAQRPCVQTHLKKALCHTHPFVGVLDENLY